MNDETTLAVVVERLEALRGDFSELREELRRSHEDKVSRAEYNEAIKRLDDKDLAQGREIYAMKQSAESRRPPWTAVLGSITGVGALIISLVLAVRALGS